MFQVNIHAATARVARAVRKDDQEEETDARRDLAEAKITVAIDKALAVAPPLSPAQVKRLSGPRRGGSQK